MKNINKIIRMASVGAALAVVFTIAGAAPSAVNACNGQCYVHYSPSFNTSNSGYSYVYSTPSSYPVYYPVYEQAPQPVYQQPVYQQPVYQQPIYQQPVYQTYAPLTVSCYPSSSSVSVGASVTWEAYPSGGAGAYTYTWSGTNGSYNTNASAYSTYSTPGSYTASVTVYSNGQTVTQSCGYVTVAEPYSYNYAQPTYYQQPVYQQQVVQQNSGSLVAACFANTTVASIGTPVTWAVEVTGGTGQYTYSWSGTDGLAGTGASAVQSYNTAGQKNAAVLITSNGQTISQACGDSVDVRSYVAPSTTNYQGPAPTNAATNSSNPNSLSAAALYSLGNIPWGWIAILIIIILGVTVFYLLFNRHKV